MRSVGFPYHACHWLAVAWESEYPISFEFHFEESTSDAFIHMQYCSPDLVP